MKYRIKEYKFKGEPMFVAQKKGIFGWSEIWDTVSYHQKGCKKMLCKIIKHKDFLPKYQEVSCDDM